MLVSDFRAEVLEWLQANPYLPELSEYIGLPSRSNFKEEVVKSEQFAASLMEKYGLKNVGLHETIGNPVVYGESLAGEGLPTVLIYGHADVQPEGDLSKWDSDPFVATKRGDKLFGRGTADNKGQHYAQFLALAFLKEKYPNVFSKINVKMILDGDEELGSYSIPGFIKKNTDLLKCDFVYVSDGPALVTDRPTIVGSVRGILTFQVNIKHNQGDLHSGNFGGVARSATRDMADLINSMVDPNGKALIEGYYDDVLDPSEVEQKALSQLDVVYDNNIKEYGITVAPTFDGHSNIFLNECYPTLNVNGFAAGGVNEQRRTIIPSEAILSVDCRMVPAMDPEKLKQQITNHIENWRELRGIAKDAVHLEFESPMAPIMTSLNSDFIEPVAKAAKIGFGVEPILVPRLGGSLPIYLFPEHLKVPVILVPYALPDENNHAPNENLDLPYFESGVAMTAALIRTLAGDM